MTRQEKESLLYSLYKASYYYGVKSLALEEAADERTKDLRDYAQMVVDMYAESAADMAFEVRQEAMQWT